MKISLIVNTACGDAAVASKRNPHRAAVYAERLHHLERIVDSDFFDEVIIVGSVPEPVPFKRPHLRWIAVPPRRRDRSDALWQRETGARFATGDILVFTHDDHSPAGGFVERLQALDPNWDIVVPKRVHALTGETLNNGAADDYMGGHTLAVRRTLWARVPWTSVDTEYWDVPMTRIWREAGARIVFDDDLVHLDLEASAEET